MLTSTTLLSRIRSIVSDNSQDSTTYTFQDPELQDFLLEAIIEYSGYRPYRGRSTVISVAGQDTYALPTDAVWISGVRWQADQDIAYLYNIYSYEFYNTWVSINEISMRDRALWKLRDDSLSMFSEIGQPIWDIWNGQLMLFPAPNENGINIVVDYGAIHAADGSGNYPTIPTSDVPLITRFLEARLLDTMATLFDIQGDYSQGQTIVKRQAADLRKRATVLRAEARQGLDEGIGFRG